jgi:pimeloyl-ACP methyl ester carboxylesterase
MHLVEDGSPRAPAVLQLGNAATPVALWDPVVPSLASACRVIRVDLLGHDRPARGYDLPAQARRVGAALDQLGVNRVTVIGHSSGACRRMTHRSFVAAMRTPLDYLGQRSLPDRLATPNLPLLVIFGTEDRRWRSSSAADYRAVPGARVEMLPDVGHTPITEDPQTTASLLLDFAAAGGHPH